MVSELKEVVKKWADPIKGIVTDAKKKIVVEPLVWNFIESFTEVK
jgi:hypothetical protein